ncbi:MAG: hypothetical protein U5R31_14335 [Acidimicrobiia bacterium]|nr:hypothetical protein [Acidimicrobiia bacterium]
MDVADEHGLLFVRDGVGVAARGEATRIPIGLGDSDVGHVAATLGAIAREGDDGPPGTGPVAIGALPFIPGPGGHWSSRPPEAVVTRTAEGTTWSTRIDAPGHEDTGGSPTGGPMPPEPRHAR